MRKIIPILCLLFFELSGLANQSFNPTSKESPFKNIEEAIQEKKVQIARLERQKSYEAALNELFNLGNLEDSLKSLKLALINDELKEKFEKEKQEEELSSLNTKTESQESQIQFTKRSTWAVSLALVGFLILGIFLLRLYRRVQKQKKQISLDLEEKDSLLREIHHRVKNNLQVISSLLNLQTRQTTNEQALSALNEGKNRVKSMALIHQSLYQTNDLIGVNVKEYVKKLATSLFNSYKVEEGRVKLRTEIEDMDLDVDSIIPIGLILNELITNALKYAFPNSREGVLSISLNNEIGSYLLSVKDDGVGLPESFDVKSSKSLGMRLIQSFTQKLKADLNISSKKGTLVELRIPKPKEAKHVRN